MINPRITTSEETKIDGNTPALRLFALLEVIAQRDQFFSLQSLVDELNLPKPTLHRMLQQLEGAGMIQRDGDGRQYSTGLRLRRMAENLLLNNTVHGARNLVLRQLIGEVGESCNLTTCVGHEVLYLDRVETEAPLRFYLRSGSRVPLHCSASGKLFLAQMTQLQRRRLLAHLPLEKYTEKTLRSYEQIDREMERVRRDGYAIDDEEFLSGLLCVATLVPASSGKSNMAVAIQAPIMRMTAEKSLQCLPALQRAARALAEIEKSNGQHVPL